MPSTVELYGTAYGHFAEPALAEVRRETYGDDFGQSSWVTADEYRRFVGLLGLSASDHVLDVGSGSGGPALFLARAAGCRVTGVDVDEAGLRTAAGLVGDGRARRARRVPPGRRPGAAAVRRRDVRRDRLPRRGLPHDRAGPGSSPSGSACSAPAAGCSSPTRWWSSARCRRRSSPTRSSTGPFEFCASGVNERLLAEAGFDPVAAADATANEAEVSRRWRDAREARRDELERIEGAETFAGLQRFLDVVHRLTAERRLVRVAYLARKPGVRPSPDTAP